MEKKTMIKIETEEKETFKDKVAKHKTVILTGVGLIALGVGSYFGYKYKIKCKEAKMLDDSVKRLVEENMNLEIAIDDLTDDMYVIKKTLADGEIVEQALSKTENQLSYLAGKLAKYMKLSEERPDDKDIINIVKELRGKLSHLDFIKERQLEMKSIAEHFEE